VTLKNPAREGGGADGLTAKSKQIIQYLRLAIWPSDLVLDYGMVRPLTLGDVAPFAAAMGLLFVGVVVALFRKPKWGYLGAWFFVTLAPTSSIVPILTEVGAERRMYLPMMAVAIALMLAAYSGWKRLTIYGRWVDVLAIVTLAVVSTALVSATRQRNTEYASGLTMWQTVVDRWPHGRAHYNLALALKAVGRRDEELIELRNAVRDSPEARSVLGIELLDQGQVADGITELQTFIREQPDHINVVVAHGRLAEGLFRPAALSRRHTRARAYLSHRPDAVGPWTNLGSLAATEQTQEAVVHSNGWWRSHPRTVGLIETWPTPCSTSTTTDARSKAREACRPPQDAGAREILDLALAASVRPLVAERLPRALKHLRCV
jgi:hypothetical protein